MHFFVIFGPPAVGKMTIGMELSSRIDVKLFHNHTAIEFVQPYFGYDTKTGRKLVTEFRTRLFEEIALSGNGLIFTYVWSFDTLHDKVYIDTICEIFKKQGAKLFFIELYSDITIRIERNQTELRLFHKPSKRNVEQSNTNLLQTEKNYRMNTYENEFYYPEQYLKINNTNMLPKEVVDCIINYFNI